MGCVFCNVEAYVRCRGYVSYVVSSLGVTGVHSKITTDIGAMTQLSRESTSLPRAIWFGISTPDQAAALANSVIVGSAIVQQLAQYGKDAPAHLEEYARAMKAAIQ